MAEQNVQAVQPGRAGQPAAGRYLAPAAEGACVRVCACVVLLARHTTYDSHIRILLPDIITPRPPKQNSNRRNTPSL